MNRCLPVPLTTAAAASARVMSRKLVLSLLSFQTLCLKGFATASAMGETE